MSEPKTKKKNQTLASLLALRSLGISSVAKMIFSGHAHVSQVLRGQRKGTVTWNKLVKVLNQEELLCALKYANKRLKKQGVILKLDESEAEGGEAVIRVVASTIEGAAPEKSAFVKRTPEMFHVEHSAA